MQIAVMIVFLVVAGSHLFACFAQWERLRVVTKPLLLPLLALYYALAATAAQQFSALVLAGLLLGCAGDVLLLKAEKPLRFGLGLLSFLLGHVFYCMYMISRIQSVPWVLGSLLACVYVAAILLLYRGLRAHLPGMMKPLVFLYGAVICFMSLCAMAYARNGLGMLPFIGSLLFLLSDSVLSRQIFVEDRRYDTFIIMLTYAAAQLCIALGFAA